MTYTVSSGTLNLTQPNPRLSKVRERTGHTQHADGQTPPIALRARSRVVVTHYVCILWVKFWLCINFWGKI